MSRAQSDVINKSYLYTVSSPGIFSHELTLEKQLSHSSSVASMEL
jgi:hypothetical protein